MGAPLLHPPSAAVGQCPTAVLTDTWNSFQGTEGYKTLADTEAEALRFSGCPERIELWVLDNPAIVRFTDEQGRPLATIQTEAGMFYEPQIRAHAIQARNATAGLNARIQVIGKWMRNQDRHQYNCACGRSYEG